MDEEYLVVTDSGIYSNYSIIVRRCQAADAQRLVVLHKQFERLLRQKRFVVPPESVNPYVSEAEQRSHFLAYGGHEDIRLIQRVTGKPLCDDVSDTDSVAGLIGMYERYIGFALPERPRVPKPTNDTPTRDDEKETAI